MHGKVPRTLFGRLSFVVVDLPNPDIRRCDVVWPCKLMTSLLFSQWSHSLKTDPMFSFLLF